jgi:MbtH protein
VANPFEDRESQFLALCNDEGQYSIWPSGIPVPPGWHIALDAASRQVCLKFIEDNWTDLRPASLIQAMREFGG